MSFTAFVAYLFGTALTNESNIHLLFFGDGSVDSGITTSHKYIKDGTFSVVLTGTDSCEYESTDSVDLIIDPPNLVASFDQSASVVPIDTTVYFTDTSTTDGPGSASPPPPGATARTTTS